MIGIWTASQVMFEVVPSFQRMLPAALTIAESESLVFDPLKNELELTRSLTVFEVPRVMTNPGAKVIEHELPYVGLQLC